MRVFEYRFLCLTKRTRCGVDFQSLATAPEPQATEKDIDDPTVQVKRGHWYRCWDPVEMYPFYWHEITQETTWDAPPIFQTDTNGSFESALEGDHIDEEQALLDDEPEVEYSAYREQKRLQAIERHKRQQRDLERQELRRRAEKEAERRRAEQQAQREAEEERARLERQRQQARQRPNDKTRTQRALDEAYYRDWKRLRAQADGSSSPDRRHAFSSPSKYATAAAPQREVTTSNPRRANEARLSSDSYRSSDRSNSEESFQLRLDRRGKKPGLKLRKHAQYKVCSVALCCKLSQESTAGF